MADSSAWPAATVLHRVGCGRRPRRAIRGGFGAFLCVLCVLAVSLSPRCRLRVDLMNALFEHRLQPFIQLQTALEVALRRVPLSFDQQDDASVRVGRCGVRVDLSAVLRISISDC